MDISSLPATNGPRGLGSIIENNGRGTVRGRCKGGRVEGIRGPTVRDSRRVPDLVVNAIRKRNVRGDISRWEIARGRGPRGLRREGDSGDSNGSVGTETVGATAARDSDPPEGAVTDVVEPSTATLVVVRGLGKEVINR